MKPILVGFGQKNIITSVKNEGYNEKLNEAGNIYPVSLFDAQLKLRLHVNNL
jgi:hypothetical protein